MTGHSESLSPFLEELASRISEELADRRDLFAPSQLDLAKRYEVSRSSIRRAVKILEDRGVLLRRQGRRMIISANRELHLKPKPKKRAGEKVEEYLREQIREGQIRSQDHLPKVEFLSRELETSSVTICRAFARLSEQGLIHKAGKSWIAGPCLSANDDDRFSVILVLQQKPHSWINLDDSRTGGFVRAFTHESRIHKTVIISVVADDRFSYYGWFPSGKEAVERIRKTYGARLRGALIAGATSEISNLSGWAEYLAKRLGQVVWFDRHGEKDKLIENRTLVRCRFSSQPALRLALEYLRNRNHTQIAYLDFMNEPWSIERGRSLAEMAAGMGMNLRRIDPQSSLCAEEAKRYFRDAVAGARGLMEPEPDYTVDRIRIVVTGLAVGATAILAANDEVARRVYSLFKNRGILIPERISLLSFDNKQMVFPFDSVDFGFDHLGYSAFHTLLGDIPIRYSRNRVVETRPWIAQRASTATI